MNNTLGFVDFSPGSAVVVLPGSLVVGVVGVCAPATKLINSSINNAETPFKESGLQNCFMRIVL